MPISQLEILSYAGLYLQEKIEEVHSLSAQLTPGYTGKRMGRPPGQNKANSNKANSNKASSNKAKSVVVLAEEAGAVESVVPVKNLHPRDPDHPDHKKWIVKLRKSQRKFWDSLTPAKQKERVKKMLQAKEAKYPSAFKSKAKVA